MKKSKKKRHGAGIFVARALIFVGIALILFAVIYEAANYPWKTLFGKEEDFFIDTMPDPAPPSDPNIKIVPFDPSNMIPEPEGEVSDLPAGDNFGDLLAGPSEEITLSILGALKIPRIDVSANIVDGITLTHLLYGVGHVRGTALPGQAGNCAIAGHRTTLRYHPFRHIDKMRTGDVVYLHMDGHIYTYTVYDTFIVDRTEKWVMGPVGEEKYCLTLISCHPLGTARQRYIQRARLTDIDGLTPEVFFASPPPSGEPTPGDVSPPPSGEPASGDVSSPPEDTPSEPVSTAPVTEDISPAPPSVTDEPPNE